MKLPNNSAAAEQKKEGIYFGKKLGASLEKGKMLLKVSKFPFQWQT
jgi:hypothetical protein